ARHDRPHPTPAYRSTIRGRTSGRRTRPIAWKYRGISGAIPLRGLSRYPTESHDRWDFARRDSTWPKPVGLLGADYRRGPRAQPEYRFFTRLPQPTVGQTR